MDSGTIETVGIVVGDAMALYLLGSLKVSNKSISVDRLLCVATRNVPDPGSSDAHQPAKTTRRNQTTPKTKRQSRWIAAATTKQSTKKAHYK